MKIGFSIFIFIHKFWKANLTIVDPPSKGMMDFVSSDHGIAKDLRKYVIFKFFPVVCPDGVFLGNSRSWLYVSYFLSILSHFLSREKLTQKNLSKGFGQFYYSRMEVLQIAQPLTLVIFVSVFLLRVNKQYIIRTLDALYLELI